MKRLFYLLFVLLMPSFLWAQGIVKIQDVTTIKGEHDNVIFGAGLISGLEGTGDQDDLDKIKAELAMLKKMNKDIDIREADITSSNVAYVVVQGTLKPYVKTGQEITVSVISKGSAKSLKNGYLMPTLLYHPYLGKDKIFAIAWGPVNVDEKSPNTGTVKAIVEEEVPVSYITKQGEKSYFFLNLRQPNFANTHSIANDINLLHNNEGDEDSSSQAEIEPVAKAVDASQVRVRIPKKYSSNEISFIADIQKIPLGDFITDAKVLINSRTGTVVITGNVKLDPVAIAHGELVVKVQRPNQAPVDQSLANLQGGFNLNALVDSLNQLGAKPKDLVKILQKLHKIGALHAKLEID